MKKYEITEQEWNYHNQMVSNLIKEIYSSLILHKNEKALVAEISKLYIHRGQIDIILKEDDQ